MVARRVGAWLVAGIAGSLVFWLVQVLAGGPTITAFMGDQIVSTGGYPKGLSTLAGWAVQVGVSLSYAFLFGVVVAMLEPPPVFPAELAAARARRTAPGRR